MTKRGHTGEGDATRRRPRRFGVGVLRWLRLSTAARAVLAVGIIAAVVVHVAALHVREAESARRLESKVGDLSLLSRQISVRVDQAARTLRTTIELSGGDTDADAFARVAEHYLAEGSFAAVILLRPQGQGFETLAVAGEPSLDEDTYTQEIRARLFEATQTPDPITLGNLGTPLETALGMAVGPALPGGGVIYAEVSIEGLVQSAFAPLSPLEVAAQVGKTALALYTDDSERTDRLIFTTTLDLPVEGQRAEFTVPFGGTTWHAVVAPRDPLLTPFEQRLPTMILFGALGTVLLLTAVVEVMLRRRVLSESEERFRLLVQGSSDITLLVDAAGTIRYASPSLHGVLDLSAEDRVGTHAVELLHPGDRRSLEDALARSGPAEEVRLEHRALHRDGSVRHLETTVTDLRGEPRIGGFVLNSRDLTDRKAAELAQQRLASIVEATSDLVVVAAPDGRIHYMNEAVRSVLGRPLRATQLTDLVADEDRTALVLRAVPGAIERGSWKGEFTLQGRGGPVSVSTVLLAHRDQDGAVSFVSAIFRDLSEQKALEARLLHQAMHDPLTGLPNRTMLAERLDTCLRSGGREGRPVSVAIIDLDGFKLVNDTLGHDAGDELLRIVAGRIASAVRPDDVVARLGGDEFAVVLDDADRETATRVAERVRVSVGAPLVVAGREVMVTASLGMGVGMAGAITAAELLRDADLAMYEAKRRGRDGVVACEPSLRTQARDQFDLRRDLQRALDAGEFELHYQPGVAIEDGRLLGAEALLRWRHPEYGAIAPTQAIPVAEETGLIVPLGRWVLEEACRTLVSWRERVPVEPAPRMSVNVSPRQLVDPSFVDDVESVLSLTGADPRSLVLEITESAFISDADDVLGVLWQLRELGVLLAIDDFGTGYSSLRYLQQLPIDVLKIDRVFVESVRGRSDDPALISAIVGVGEAVGIDVLAEGIERPEQAAALLAQGCKYGQGYHFARPMPGSDFEAMLAAADGVAPRLPGALADVRVSPLLER